MDTLRTWTKEKSFWISFLLLMLIKYGYYGFRYFPILDDWIQYGRYPFEENIFRTIIIGLKTYTTRPLASLSDPYIWGQFWGRMSIAFFIITILHVLSGFFIYRVLEYQKLCVGMPFLLIYGLLPLGSEATYWISASSRVVVGVFWMALALYLFTLYLQTAKKRYMWGFFVTHLLSMGYYEQVIALSVFSAILLVVANWKRLHAKWVIGIPFLNFIFIAAYYKIFGSIGNVAQRGQFVKSDFISHFMLAFDKITDVWGQVQIPLMTNGFIRGLEVLIQNSSYVFLLLMFVVSCAAALLNVQIASNQRNIARYINISKVSIIQIVLGIILFWVPFGPNFLLDTVWICNRNAFTSFIGLGLIVQGMVALICRGKIGEILKIIGVGAAAFVFLTVNVSELTDYKNAGEIDRKICTNIIEAIDEPAFFAGEKKAIIVNAQSAYIEQNSYHHDHIHNVTSSDWALTGGVRAVAKNSEIPSFIMQMYPGSGIQTDEENWYTSIVLGIDSDLSVIPLNASKNDKEEIMLLRNNGQYFGEMILNDRKRYEFKIGNDGEF